MEVLVNKLDFPLKSTMDSHAPQKFREAPNPAEFLSGPREPDNDEAFSLYVVQFQGLATDIVRRRSAWGSIASADDPMKYDEVAMRSLESAILTDLFLNGANDKLLKLAHCDNVRSRVQLAPLPEKSTKADTKPMLAGLILAIENMKKSYKSVRETMRLEPSPDIAAR